MYTRVRVLMAQLQAMHISSDAAEVCLRSAPERFIGFAGLGAMGYHMAGHIARMQGHQCLVWNRTIAKAEQHAKDFGSKVVREASELGKAEVVVFCLPTSAEDVLIAEEVAPHLSPGACLLSCTSGEPSVTRRLSASLKERFGVHLLDCPVSGGPRGAEAGSLTIMLGADNEEAVDRALPILNSFAKKVVRCGPSGAGHAVKAVNNALNCAHLMLGAEGLLALQSMGIDPAVALEAINGSSGRSLQTEQRLPQEVLTGKFSYGFKLPLMAKDCRIASGVLREGLPSARLLPAAMELVQQAAHEMPEDADYTTMVKLIEKGAGMDLRSSNSSKP